MMILSALTVDDKKRQTFDTDCRANLPEKGSLGLFLETSLSGIKISGFVRLIH